MTNNHNHQPNKQRTFTSLKRYISLVSIWGSCLKLLRVDNTCLLSPSLLVLVRLLPRDDLGLYLCLYFFYCAYIFNSLGICAQIMAAQGLRLHIQFPQDMCTNFVFLSSDWYGSCACIFNSWRIYVQSLYYLF